MAGHAGKDGAGALSAKEGSGQQRRGRRHRQRVRAVEQRMARDVKRRQQVVDSIFPAGDDHAEEPAPRVCILTQTGRGFVE
jgi:hypothetical protein